MASYLTAVSRDYLTKILMGGSSDCNLDISTDISIGVYQTSAPMLFPTSGPTRISNEIQASYVLGETQYLSAGTPEMFVDHGWTEFSSENLTDDIKLWSKFLSIDKRSTSALGDFILTIVKRDIVI
jgi:hypothetical protein